MGGPGATGGAEPIALSGNGGLKPLVFGKSDYCPSTSTSRSGDETATVAEFSSGTSTRAAASHLVAVGDLQMREELMFGAKVTRDLPELTQRAV